jgi:hypothetical protein
VLIGHVVPVLTIDPDAGRPDDLVECDAGPVEVQICEEDGQ